MNSKYYIITIGCQMNKSDSERIAGYLEENGYKWCENQSQADLVVINTCGVRQKAEDRVYGLIYNIKKANPKVKIILAGCLSERPDVQKRLANKVDIWLPIVQLPKLANLLVNKFGKPKKEDYLKIEPKYQSKLSAFVPIGNGCNNFCAYCVVPYARGREVYRPAQDVLDEVENLVKDGYKEIVLIAQNVNSYKFKIQNHKSQINSKFKIQKFKTINFSELLRLINNISGEFWIKFATSHPKDMSDELIKTVSNCKKVCEHIHLPVQSGDNKILTAMNRNYTVAHYKKLIKKIRKAMPGVSITTDIIVGFPGETKRQFNNTVKLFRELKFDMAYISKYSPRPGTAAAKLEDNVSLEEKKKREEELMKILRRTALENNKKYIGKIVEVLVSGKNKKGEWFGYTRTNKNVKLKVIAAKAGQGNKKLEVRKGEFVKVKITKAQDFGMEGEMV